MPGILSRLSILFLNYISCDFEYKKTFIQAFRSVRGCQTCMCKSSIKISLPLVGTFSDFDNNTSICNVLVNSIIFSILDVLVYLDVSYFG